MVTMLSPSHVSAARSIPGGIRGLFELVVPVGPYTALHCIFGNYFAPNRLIRFARGRRQHSTARQAYAALYLPDLALFVFLVVTFVTNAWSLHKQ
jgi:hypothetical protein